MCEIYNYREAVTRDVKSYLKEYGLDPAVGYLDDLMDEVASADEVTGIGSGSYTMNGLKAEQNLNGNWGLLKIAIKHLNPDFDVIEQGPERADCLIRAYLAPLVILGMTY